MHIVNAKILEFSHFVTYTYPLLKGKCAVCLNDEKMHNKVSSILGKPRFSLTHAFYRMSFGSNFRRSFL